MSVTVNAPKTPVTEGSSGVAAATVPNICKMPGPPAPFVPTPLPNIGKSGDSPKDYSKDVRIEGKKVAIKGATFKSMGDVASKSLGGGVVSMNTEGPTSFVGPGPMDVKIEGKNVQLLGDPMLNNCGPSGSPPNAATMVGVVQAPGLIVLVGDEPCPLCGKTHGDAGKVEDTSATQGDSDKLRAAADRAVAAAEAKRKQLDEERMAADRAEAQAEYDRRVQSLQKRIADERIPLPIREKAQADLAALQAQGPAEPKPGIPASLSTMLGVVHCKDAKVYAGKSVQQLEELTAEIVQIGWHTPPSVASILGPIPAMGDTQGSYAAHLGNKGAFSAAWDRGVVANQAWRDTPAESKGEPFYPPGQCAAQQMVLLALDHGGRPTGLTERWYKSGDPSATVEVHFRPSADSEPRAGRFGGNKAVPPCGTCQVVLTALMCPDDRAQECAHKTPASGVCKLCG